MCEDKLTCLYKVFVSPYSFGFYGKMLRPISEIFAALWAIGKKENGVNM
jgi:hypothetical protein